MPNIPANTGGDGGGVGVGRTVSTLTVLKTVFDLAVSLGGRVGLDTGVNGSNVPRAPSPRCRAASTVFSTVAVDSAGAEVPVQPNRDRINATASIGKTRFNCFNLICFILQSGKIYGLLGSFDIYCLPLRAVAQSINTTVGLGNRTCCSPFAHSHAGLRIRKRFPGRGKPNHHSG